MTAEFYKNTILQNHVILYIEANEEAKKFQQNNCTKHASQSTIEALNKIESLDFWTQKPPPPCKQKK